MIIIFIECLIIHIAMSLCLCHHITGMATWLPYSTWLKSVLLMSILKTFMEVHLFIMLVGELMRKKEISHVHVHASSI